MKEGDKPPTYSPQAIHLVRTVTQTNLTLSQMADQKASILMGATFVVFTIAVGQAGRGQLTLPLMILAIFAFLSAVCAVAAILPAITPRKNVTASQNVLFFERFTRMSEAEFADAVLGELTSDERIYRLMLRDIYQNGQVLRRKKYRLLGYAYRLFLIGITLTLLAFLIEQRAVLLSLFT